MSFRRIVSAAQDAAYSVLAERDSAGALSFAYIPDGGPAVPGLRGIFRDAHLEADLDLETIVSTVDPVVSFKIADLPEYPPSSGALITIARGQGDPEAIGTQTFRITDHQPDGEGDVDFVLTLA